ncbi:MAG: LacI family DNA-binding transcriptional regulator [Butyricicoccus sp.]|nr:LacI family DNA-binding transcriptional regulator [Butyricicoccus sp.]
MKRVTLQDIALRCGVSRGTVDRVVNGRGEVAPAVRERVQRALDESGYRTPRQRRQAEEDCPVRIGIIAPERSDYYKKKTREGIRAAIRQIGDKRLQVLIEEPIGRSAGDYRAAIRRLEEQGMNGLVIQPVDMPAVQAEIDRLTAAGIPVVTAHTDVPDSRRICCVGQDALRAGRVAAGLLAPYVTGGDVLVICSSRVFRSHAQRVEGFLNRMHELGDPAHSVRVLECIERYDLTFDGVTEALRKSRRLRAIYLTGESVSACVDALAHGLPEPAEHPVHVVCSGLTPAARKYLADGKVDFVIDSDPAGQIGIGVVTLYDLLCRGRKPEKTVKHTRTSIVTRELL